MEVVILGSDLMSAALYVLIGVVFLWLTLRS